MISLKTKFFPFSHDGSIDAEKIFCPYMFTHLHKRQVYSTTIQTCKSGIILRQYRLKQFQFLPEYSLNMTNLLENETEWRDS